jgi:hypothetical protein
MRHKSIKPKGKSPHVKEGATFGGGNIKYKKTETGPLAKPANCDKLKKRRGNP